MVRLLQVLWDAVRSSVASPGQDPARTLLVAAIALTALLFVVVVLLMALSPRRRKVVKIRRYRLKPGEDDGYYHPELEGVAAEAAGSGVALEEAAVTADEAESSPGQAASESKPAKRVLSPSVARVVSVISVWGVFLLVLAAVVSGYWVTGTDAYCTKTCHGRQATVVKAAKLGHASCVSCHERPGVSAVPQNLVNRVSMVVSQLRGVSSSGAVVDSSACLRCHRKAMAGVVVSSASVKMSHAEPNAAGVTCTNCHAATGHSMSRNHSMAPCLVCHDGKKASADCLSCHVKQPLATVAIASTSATLTLGSGRIAYPLVELPSRQCGLCHDEASQCDTCHGLRMPHPVEFKKGGHAPYAAFERKQTCWKCHRQTDCGRCHGSFTNHGLNWKQLHKSNPWDATCSCHEKTQIRTCLLCHNQVPPHALLH